MPPIDGIDIQPIGALILTILVIGSGYTVLWFRSKVQRKSKQFYNMNSYDKAIQSLIFGSIVFLLAYLYTNISLASIESLTIDRSTLFAFIGVEAFGIFFTATYSIIGQYAFDELLEHIDFDRSSKESVKQTKRSINKMVKSIKRLSVKKLICSIPLPSLQLLEVL